ncbi:MULTISPECIES: NAD(P)H-dependent oxidoreductase [Pseudoalteromonas]|uniref:NADPH-dependent FMN reductase n=1 Tax=Pseudoalteromonas TaxID=53246 RepID=UPI001EF401B1|nr:MULTISPECIES: NAD(P)H-dependent oxidoreductase [Pseudoalteromonas]MCG7561079.1 NAD(P)H-dependent oxidoreductase [Pseudoalteromonas sp. McH1-42]MEC4088160.1 NAD(P)H-dependent oxidoreductase [Pseudoalteromonas rubra]
MKVLVFAASNSRQSINQQLASYAASLIPNAEVEVLDLNDYEMPIYSIERETDGGIPDEAQRFFAKIGAADAIIVSFAEHNGSYTAAYKNLFDWTSRIDMKVYQNTPMLMMATSPGPGGAKSVLASAVGSAPYFAADVKASLSVPSFFDNFDLEAGELKNTEIKQELEAALKLLH